MLFYFGMDFLIQLNEKLLTAMRVNSFSGYDPFDFLNSKFLKSTLLSRSEMVRLAWLQLGKRLPINFRRLFGVPKKRNPKGIALFILGLIQDFKRTGDDFYLVEANELAEWLLDNRSKVDEWNNCCWGYHFDWQARAFFVPAGKPNVITTVYVARALYELGDLTGKQQLTEVALDAAKFISRHLYTLRDGRQFYAYIPGENAFVHNASLWGAAWCAFAGKKLGDQQLINQALGVARQSVKDQCLDGSWVYGARHHHQFVDGFHTGYNLEALKFLRDALGADEFDDSIARGYRYYVDTFFEGDGTAKYYNNSVYPIDMHSFAQAVFTLLKVGGQKTDVELCEKVIKRAINLMYVPRTGLFIYQKNRFFTNRINYVRWTQAWAYSSIAFYNRFISEDRHASN